MDIGDFLSVQDVIRDCPAIQKSLLLSEFGARAASALRLDAEAIARDLLKREELGSTGIGSGVAIPHARIAILTKPFGILARLEQPIDFDAIDGQPVDIVFLLLLPASAAEHLNALAAVARRLRSREVADALRNAPDGAAMHRIMVADSR